MTVLTGERIVGVIPTARGLIAATFGQLVR